MSTITINDSQQLFVIPAGDGFSTRGFRSLFVELVALLARLGLSDPRASEDKIGTLEQYEAYQGALGALRARGGFKTTWFHPETPEAVRRVLERAMKSRELLRIYSGDAATGRDWGEENDVIGQIGRSTGLMRVPLLIGKGEFGGPALLDHCIVKIQRVSDGKVLYQHATYQPPALAIQDETGTETARKTRLPFLVTRDGADHARFRSFGGACAYVAFMLGQSFTQPSE